VYRSKAQRKKNEKLLKTRKTTTVKKRGRKAFMGDTIRVDNVKSKKAKVKAVKRFVS
jgi:putative ribosome biogenesis GTPase RsgA